MKILWKPQLHSIHFKYQTDSFQIHQKWVKNGRREIIYVLNFVFCKIQWSKEYTVKNCSKIFQWCLKIRTHITCRECNGNFWSVFFLLAVEFGLLLREILFSGIWSKIDRRLSSRIWWYNFIRDANFDAEKII